MRTRELERSVGNGWVALAAVISTGVMLVIAWIGFAYLISLEFYVSGAAGIIGMAILSITWFVCLSGFFTLQPNEAAVLILFGKYTGTAKASGFHYTNPFYSKEKISLRRRNLNTPTIKVNDLRGNPIEIAAVIVWEVQETAQAVFDVDDYQNYVNVQAEAALRHLAMAYPYDVFHEDDHISLRGNPEEVAKALQNEVQERVSPAGVAVQEARIAHLAYAPEIAGAMLQRQQAEAIIAARSRIVEGAVGMVEMALDKLVEHGKLALDEEQKASMVTNLLVVLCGHESAHPVVNTGTLYH